MQAHYHVLALHVPVFRLQSVHVDSDQLTDASLKSFGQMQTLESRYVEDNQFTDDGIRYLVPLANLRRLWLDGDPSYTSKIGDGSVESLSRMKNLTRLNLRRTALTNEGLERLEDALPKCKIFAPW